MRTVEKRLAVLEAVEQKQETERWSASVDIAVSALSPAEGMHFVTFCDANEAQSEYDHLCLIQPDDPGRMLTRPAWMLQEWYDAVIAFGTAFWPAYHARGGKHDAVPFPIYQEAVHASA